MGGKLVCTTLMRTVTVSCGGHTQCVLLYMLLVFFTHCLADESYSDRYQLCVGERERVRICTWNAKTANESTGN